MVVLINCKQFFADSSRAIVCERRDLFWSGFGIRCKEDAVVKVMGDRRSVFSSSLTSVEDEIFFFFLAWDKSVSLNCVFFFDVLSAFPHKPMFSKGSDTSQ